MTRCLHSRTLQSLAEIAVVFLKLGLIAVGGPAAHVALMRREIVIKRRWMEERAFLDDFAACQLIPGPSSTELAILMGYRRGGAVGLIVAGTLFILPAMLIMLVLAWVYVHFATATPVAHALRGVRPVVVGIIAWAVYDLGRPILRRGLDLVVAALVLVAGLAGVNPIVLLLAGGLALTLLRSVCLPRPGGGTGRGLLMTTATAATNTSLVGIFLAFLKYGAVSFGSGYVLFAFLHADVVSAYHWMTDSQLVDAIAISQATPGPVFTVATFIGYQVAGLPGALLATAGIFLPGFVLVAFLRQIMRVVNERPFSRQFLAGVNVAALGLIGEVAIQLGRGALRSPVAIILAIATCAVLLRVQLAGPALVLAGALAGLAGII